MRVATYSLMVLIAALMSVGGCPPEEYDAEVGAKTPQIDAIRDNTDLTGQEKRDALAALGLDPTLINATLKDDRTANQYGGTLRSAYEKVTTDGRLTELTPDEIQLYSDAVDDDAGTSVDLTDAQARAVQKFLVDNALGDTNAVEAFIGDAGNEIPDEIPTDFLKNVFVEFDHSNLIPVLP